MPRASRYLVEGYTYHLTHRCHDKRRLLRFASERGAYREWLRVAAQRYGVSVYGYCITSNHVHVIARADDRHAVGHMMQLPASCVATQLNDRKGHEGSVWEHPYQCTRIQDGRHLLNCLRYVDMNMVRAGVVTHPRAWRWCGYDELTLQRKRYRIIDANRLVEALGLNDADELAAHHDRRIDERLAADNGGRESYWTDAVAVGDEDFVRCARSDCGGRRSFDEEMVSDGSSETTHVLREDRAAYSADSACKLAF